MVELPAPKIGKANVLGFEHIEIVCDDSFDDLQKKYSHLNLNDKGLLKSFNQELEICLGERNIKFHHLALAKVIEIEKNEKVFMAIKNSKILELFKQNHALAVASTAFDVDITMKTRDTNQIQEMLKKYFAHVESSYEKVDGVKKISCHFVYDQISFNIFIQDLGSII